MNSFISPAGRMTDRHTDTMQCINVYSQCIHDTDPIRLHDVVDAAQVVLKCTQFLPILLQLQTNEFITTVRRQLIYRNILICPMYLYNVSAKKTNLPRTFQCVHNITSSNHQRKGCEEIFFTVLIAH